MEEQQGEFGLVGVPSSRPGTGGNNNHTAQSGAEVAEMAVGVCVLSFSVCLSCVVGWLFLFV